MLAPGSIRSTTRKRFSPATLPASSRPRGALVLSGGGTSGKGPLWLLMGAAVAARFLPFKVLTPQAASTTDGLKRIAELVAAGYLRPVIDRTFPLEETPAAVRYLETEHAQVKVVITVR